MCLVVTGIGQNESQALGCSSCSSKTAPPSSANLGSSSLDRQLSRTSQLLLEQNELELTAPSSTTSGSQLEILESHIDQPELSAEGQEAGPRLHELGPNDLELKDTCEFLDLPIIQSRPSCALF